MGGRGSKSGMTRAGGLKNSVGASPRAVSVIEQAVRDIGTYGSARIVINTMSDTGIKPNAANPKDDAFEKQLKDLGSENGLVVSFDTKTKTMANAVRVYTYGSSRTKTQTKTRTVHVYRRE